MNTPEADTPKPESMPSSESVKNSIPPSVTRQSITITDKKTGQVSTLNFTARADTMSINYNDKEQLGEMFYVAYTLDDTKENAITKENTTRPITFCFNGGPGSSSVWLHLGGLGPRRVVLDQDGFPKGATLDSVTNEFTWLQWTDLVFIDPIGTGFSRVSGETKREEFHGVEEDVRSVGEFIRAYCSFNNRWLSPKFIAGESYGTTRCAGLSSHLQDAHGISLQGVLLISSVLNFQTLEHEHSPGNDLPYFGFLPTYSMTAYYHKRLNNIYQNDKQVLLNDVRNFINEDYVKALSLGNRISASKEKLIVKKLSDLTGISKQFIEYSNLRINPFRFTKELLRSERKIVGRLDSRFVGYDADASGDSAGDDPSYSGILYPYTAVVNDYLRSSLGYQTERRYEVLTPNVHPWNWGSASKGFVNKSADLSTAMRRNPSMNVFVANGYYDIATPFYATEYTMDHLEIERDMINRITMTYYPAGHMMYIHHPSLEQFTDDVASFYRKCLSLN